MENKDPLKFQTMADAQKARRDEINRMRIEASPWLRAVLGKKDEEK